jgi:ribosomal protein L11 methyltransferase
MPKTEDHWHSICLTVSPEAPEAIEFALNSLDALGTSIDLMTGSDIGVRVIGYFTKVPDDQIIQDELLYALRIYGLDESAILSVNKKEIENTDWLAEWKKYWKPSTIGNFVVAAPWHEVDEPDKMVIRIEPNMAFGTGTHETTQLCLKAVDELYTPGDSFLDVGTGTGILAIAAALKGRNTSGSECAILGSDNDPETINIAIENAELNQVSRFTRFQVGSVSHDGNAFDFVCANLTLDVIAPILPLLLSKARSYLILSGILKTQEPNIVERLENCGCREFTIEKAGEWIAVIIQMTDSR